MNDFPAKFAAYIKTTVASQAAPANADLADAWEATKVDMLKAFAGFLAEDCEIPDSKLSHFELLAKMTEFAKGGGRGGPST